MGNKSNIFGIIGGIIIIILVASAIAWADKRNKKPRSKAEFLKKISELELENRQFRKQVKLAYAFAEELNSENKKLRKLCINNNIKFKSKLRSVKVENLSADKIKTGFKELVVGQTAFFSGQNSPRVEQIIDNNNMIARIVIRWEFVANTSRSQESFLLTRQTGREKPVYRSIWIKGLDTFGMVERSKIKTKRPFTITGTKTYEDLRSKNTTVFVLEPISLRR